MAATRRTQLLMEPEEFARLRAEARRRKTSVAQLIRSAVRETYLSSPPDRGHIVDAILSMGLPVMEWKRVRKEIEAALASISCPSYSGCMRIRFISTQALGCRTSITTM
jgi:hypothetical protein